MNFSKKSLGQNFLIDLNIIKKITNQVEIKNNNILEIGPGKGALTNQILKKKPKSLILIEKDNVLYDKLKFKYKIYKNIKIYNKDILKCNIEKILKKNTIIFGNLPYNISTQILIKFIKFSFWPPKFEKLIFMFQKEVAERLLAESNNSKYGRLTVISKFRFKIENFFHISKNSFYPVPKVDSTVLVFRPINNKDYLINDKINIEEITHDLFSNRRKMINKTIRKNFDTHEKLFKELKINPNWRPAELNENHYFKLAERLEKIKKLI